MSLSSDHRSVRRGVGARTVVTLVASVLLATALSSCLAAPGDTARIEKIQTVSEDGWTFDYYRNRAYPCSVSGYQTFVVARRAGSSDTAARPLWVRMHGGGIGWFAPDGTVVGSVRNKSEEPFSRLKPTIGATNLEGRIAGSGDGYRMLSVSMCSHDLYSGANTTDPNNPNITDGATPRTNGLLATKAAIQFVTGKYPTDDFFLHGGSAGSGGSYSVAWALQQQNLAPTGVVADSGVINRGFEAALVDAGSPCARPQDGTAIFEQRVHPSLADPANEPHLLISQGRLTVPIMQVYSTGDINTCGPAIVNCPNPDGTTTPLGSTICANRPVRSAIQAQGPSSRSKSLELCVDNPNIDSGTNHCDKHVSTQSDYRNTLPGQPADYNATILSWINTRRTDDT